MPVLFDRAIRVENVIAFGSRPSVTNTSCWESTRRLRWARFFGHVSVPALAPFSRITYDSEYVAGFHGETIAGIESRAKPTEALSHQNHR